MNLHDKSCMLDAFILGINNVAWEGSKVLSYENAIGHVGHDGRERGFHSQELIDLADTYGVQVTEIQRYPVGVLPNGDTVEISFLEGTEARFMGYLKDSSGVLMGRKNGRGHAVYWNSQNFYDPANGLWFPLIHNDKINEAIYNPLVLLRFNYV